MYRITRVLSVGRFVTPELAPELHASGITHILNVSHSPSSVAASAGGFREVEWIPVEDQEPIPPPTIIQLLDTLHGMAIAPESQVYVHCIAGQRRSPTVLWLYLIACGIHPDVRASGSRRARRMPRRASAAWSMKRASGSHSSMAWRGISRTRGPT